jgi:ribosomal protein S18 acetylase RimI-like enzyme
MNEPVTRTATPADAAALEALVNSAYRGESSKAGWTTEADLLGGQRVDVDGLRDTIAAPGHVILLREEAGALIACVHLERTAPTGDDCYVGLLTVSPTLQNRGVGRQILAAAERFAVEHWSVRSMHLTVIQQRPELMAWYERRGYERTGIHKPFPYGDERFGLPRRSDLVFEVLRKVLVNAD